MNSKVCCCRDSQSNGRTSSTSKYCNSAVGKLLCLWVQNSALVASMHLAVKELKPNPNQTDPILYSLTLAKVAVSAAVRALSTVVLVFTCMASSTEV